MNRTYRIVNGRIRRTVRKARGGLGVLNARWRGHRRPLLVGWAVTRRCNYRCAYCGEWTGEPELTTAEGLDLIDQLADAGTLVLGLTGGEPLLRQDLEPLVHHARRRGLLVTLSTNGALLPDRPGVLRSVDRVLLSLEGEAVTHDAVRGPGAFDQALAAIEAARREGVLIELAVTLNAHNAQRIGETVSLARRLGLRAIFQPAITTRIRDGAPNPLAPEPRAYREALAVLSNEKRRAGRAVVGNSFAGLRHLARWPRDAWSDCAAGHVACKITPSGEVYHCGRHRVDRMARSALKHGFLAAFQSLPTVGCHQCWCAARVELNLLYGLNAHALWNTLVGR